MYCEFQMINLLVNADLMERHLNNTRNAQSCFFIKTHSLHFSCYLTLFISSISPVALAMNVTEKEMSGCVFGRARESTLGGVCGGGWVKEMQDFHPEAQFSCLM